MNEIETHFVYAGYYSSSYNEHNLRSFILKGMKKYKIKFVMLTGIYMRRWNLITKEAMEKYCKGEKNEKDSVNDDLESLFEDLRLGKEPKKRAWTYFLPKLTEEEMELVEKKDTSYLKTFYLGDMKEKREKIQSDSKFIQGRCVRRTFTIELRKRRHSATENG